MYFMCLSRAGASHQCAEGRTGACRAGNIATEPVQNGSNLASLALRLKPQLDSFCQMAAVRQSRDSIG